MLCGVICGVVWYVLECVRVCVCVCVCSCSFRAGGRLLKTRTNHQGVVREKA